MENNENNNQILGLRENRPRVNVYHEDNDLNNARVVGRVNDGGLGLVHPNNNNNNVYDNPQIHYDNRRPAQVRNVNNNQQLVPAQQNNPQNILANNLIAMGQNIINNRNNINIVMQSLAFQENQINRPQQQVNQFVVNNLVMLNNNLDQLTQLTLAMGNKILQTEQKTDQVKNEVDNMRNHGSRACSIF